MSNLLLFGVGGSLVKKMKTIKRGLHEAIKELFEKYNCGPSGGDCDGEFDFGFSNGMELAYKDMAEDLARLLALFFPARKIKKVAI